MYPICYLFIGICFHFYLCVTGIPGDMRNGAMSVCPSVCRMPRPNWRMEMPRKPKIGAMEAHHMSNQ